MKHRIRFALSLGLSALISQIQAQEDSLRAGGDPSIRTAQLGVGGVLSEDKVHLDLTADVVFRGGWGVGTDFHTKKDYLEVWSAVPSDFRQRTSLLTLRLVKQFYLPSPRWSVQVGVGPSYGRYATTGTAVVVPGQPAQLDEKGSAFGVGSRVNLIYTVSPWMGISAGAYLGYNRLFQLQGPSVSVLVGSLGTRQTRYAAQASSEDKPLSAYSPIELADLELKTRRQASLGTVLGGVLTGLAVAVNVMAVKEYHSGDTWARLGGVSGLAISHLALAPAGTGLLIWSGGKRGKARQIRSIMGAEVKP
jgi:hypothetical protein